MGSVRILYILPTINTILLTAARDTKLTGKVQELFPEVSPGLVVRDAKVVVVSKTSSRYNITNIKCSESSLLGSFNF